MDEVTAELAQMTGAINTTSLSINSLKKGLTCCKRHILHGNFHILLCDSFIYMCSVSDSQIIQPVVRQNKSFRKVSPACREPYRPPNSQNPETVSCMCFIMAPKKMH